MIRLRAVILMLSLLLIWALVPNVVVRAEFGTNWTGQFFNSLDLTGPVVGTASYPAGLNLNWSSNPTDGAGVTVAGVPADNFSARFTSVQTFTQGTYQFVVFVDDGVRMFIDGVLVLDKFLPPTPGTTFTFNHTFTAGSHSLVVEFVEYSGVAILQVQWFSQTGAITTTPGVVVTPGATAVPSITASVVTVKGLAVRTGPYLGATMVTIARPGTAYAVNGKNRDEGLFTWYLITVGEKTGWASGRYLQITGDVNTVPDLGSVFDTIDNAPDVGIRAYPRAIMNFRRRPSIRAPLLGKIPWGEELVLVGRTVRAGSNFWLQVRYNGQVGWIFAPYVTVVGPVDAVPIR